MKENIPIAKNVRDILCVILVNPIHFWVFNFLMRNALGDLFACFGLTCCFIYFFCWAIETNNNVVFRNGVVVLWAWNWVINEQKHFA